MKRTLKIFSLTLLTAFNCVWAGTTGKIAGRVYDQQTNAAIPGANVFISAKWDDGRESQTSISQGAAADIRGDFVIINVRPGTYSVTAQVIGYEQLIISGVRVSIDRTTKIDFPLSVEAVGMVEVVVVANGRGIRTDVVNSLNTISTRDIENTPKKSFRDMLTNEAGVESDAYGITIRGGTEKEVGYLVDGVSMKDSRNNRSYTNINTELIEEVQLITGAFNAEYGQARSGIVNVVTKRSQNRYIGSFNLRYSPPALKHFGPNMWTADNWWDYGRFQHFESHEGAEYVNELGETVKAWTDENGNNIDRDRDGIVDFGGWDNYATSPLNQYKLTSEDAYKLWKYQHRNEDFARELGVDPVLKYGNVPDRTFEASFGGPLLPGGKVPVLSRMDFLLGVSTRFSAYTYPLSRKGFGEDNIQLSLNYQLTDNFRLTLFGLYGETHAAGWFLGTDHTYITNPGYIIQNVYGVWASSMPNIYAVDNNTNWVDWYRNTYALSAEHMVNSSLFYTFQVQWSDVDYQGHPPDPVDTEVYQDRFGNDRARYVSEFSLINTEGDTISFPKFPRGYDYYSTPLLSGSYTTDQNGYYLHNLLDSWGFDDSGLKTRALKGDLTWQVNSHHQIKTGFQYEWIHVIENRWGAFPRERDIEGKLIGYSGTHFDVQYEEGAAYVQDQIEYPGLVINAGLRFDFYKPESPMPDVWNNPFNPELYGHFMRDSFIVHIDSISNPVPVKTAISPRIGISHPISDVSKIYFNYGHFSQSPTTHNMYWMRYGHSASGRLEFIGNPWLPLARTINYEVGYEQEIYSALRVNVAGYYKDSRNQPQFVFYNPGTIESMWFSYQDYAYWTQKGVEARVNVYGNELISGFANYSYFLTTYGTTGPTRVRPDDADIHNKNIASQANGLAKRSFEPMIRAKAGVYIMTPRNSGPSLMGLDLLGDWRFSWIVKWRLGSRFHWDMTGQTDDSDLNWKWKDYWMVDLKIDRNFKVGSTRMSFYCSVFNIFNIKNFNVTDFGEAIYEGVDYYQAPGNPNYAFMAYGKNAPDEFDRYMLRIEQAGKQPGEEVEEAYMPKRSAMTYLFPRDIWFGIRFSF